MIPLPNPLHRKQIDYWKRMFEETGFKLKELEAKNKELMEVIKVYQNNHCDCGHEHINGERIAYKCHACEALAKHSPRNLPEGAENTHGNLPENE